MFYRAFLGPTSSTNRMPSYRVRQSVADNLQVFCDAAGRVRDERNTGSNPEGDLANRRVSAAALADLPTVRRASPFGSVYRLTPEGRPSAPHPSPKLQALGRCLSSSGNTTSAEANSTLVGWLPTTVQVAGSSHSSSPPDPFPLGSLAQ